MNRIVATILLISALPAFAQGNHGDGHDEWHGTFYSKLVTPDTKVSCCSLADCRPTQGKQVGDHYEVMINDKWVRVLPEKVVKTGAPDQGFHVCAPIMFDGLPEHVYCVVLPPES